MEFTARSVHSCFRFNLLAFVFQTGSSCSKSVIFIFLRVLAMLTSSSFATSNTRNLSFDAIFIMILLRLASSILQPDLSSEHLTGNCNFRQYRSLPLSMWNSSVHHFHENGHHQQKADKLGKLRGNRRIRTRCVHVGTIWPYPSNHGRFPKVSCPA